jgi:hypothetical protein
VKADANGRPVRFKARWVARGFTQRHGVDYEDTYASVTKPATVKIILALKAKLNLECKQFDLVTAFLNALIKKFKIYVEMQHGFEDYAEDGTQLVCFLLRALYGLKQSPLLWYEELTAFLRSIGLEPPANSCVSLAYTAPATCGECVACSSAISPDGSSSNKSPSSCLSAPFSIPFRIHRLLIAIAIWRYPATLIDWPKPTLLTRCNSCSKRSVVHLRPSASAGYR